MVAVREDGSVPRVQASGSSSILDNQTRALIPTKATMMKENLVGLSVIMMWSSFQWRTHPKPQTRPMFLT